MKPILLVMAGGAIGAAVRFGVGRAVPAVPGGWPWATFAVNILGGFAMGMLAAWVLRGDASAEPLRLFVGVGVLGGFTTFSAFSFEMAQMIQRGQAAMALLYALVSVVLALAALFGGMAIMRTLA